MKRIKDYISILLMAAVFLSVTSCNKKLTEHPYTVQSVALFQTQAGLQLGLNGIYSELRYLYGPEGANCLGDIGTDCFTEGDQARTGAAGDFLAVGFYTLDASNGQIQTPWNRLYNTINMANGIIQWAPGVNMTDADRADIMGQAHFIRGLSYLLLVEQFGAIPLDLGSGDTTFNQSAFSGMNRLPVDDILAKDYEVMIADFTYASQNLPDQRPVAAFKLSKAAAFGMLAKTYIFRGYSKFAASTDWQNAYNAATEVINNQSKYGCSLLQNFADANSCSDANKWSHNDYNAEILFAIERLPSNPNANEGDASGGQISGGKGVDAANDYNPDFTGVKSPTASSSTAPAGTRTALYGRPLRRFCPTAWLFNTLFADKTNDSRFDGTFNMVYLATQSGGGFNIGDTAFVMAHSIAEYDSLAALSKPYRVISPAEMYIIGGQSVTSQNIYPALKKYWDPSKPIPNAPGGRPYPVIKFSEIYLLAAEAAMQMGNTADAATLINVLRTRAAYRPNLSASEVATRSTALQVTASQINLDLILDERAKELCGEATRWPDLAMRNVLVSRVKAYNPDAAPNIQDFHVLRPIPQNTLDALTVPDETLYQNPGYN